MKITEIRKSTEAELQKLLSDKRAEFVLKKRALHAGELQNPKSIKVIRRDIATLMTLLNEPRDQKEEA